MLTAGSAGAIWARLVPTVTALAIYFCFADTVLIAQVLYYNFLNRRKEAAKDAEVQEVDEQTALLNGNGHASQHKRQSSLNDIREDNLGLPGSRRRSSATSSHKQTLQRTRTTSSGAGDLAAIMEAPAASAPSQTRTSVSYTHLTLPTKRIV